MRLLLSLALLVFATTNIANAASFDCAKASTPTETAICKSHQLSYMDDVMHAEYTIRLAIDPDVQNTQREWIDQHQKPCGSDEECLIAAYETRFDDWFDDAETYFAEHRALFEGNCPNAPETGFEERFLYVSEDKSYVSPIYEKSCWMGAYQGGAAFFAGDRILPLAIPIFEGDTNKIIGFTAQTTASFATFVPEEMILYSHNKDRGLGDCYSRGEWKYDGRNFVLKSYEQDSLCDEITKPNQFYVLEN